MYDFVEIPASVIPACLSCGQGWINNYRPAISHATGIRVVNAETFTEDRRNKIRGYFKLAFRLETVFA